MRSSSWDRSGTGQRGRLGCVMLMAHPGPARPATRLRSPAPRCHDAHCQAPPPPPRRFGARRGLAWPRCSLEIAFSSLRSSRPSCCVPGPGQMQLPAFPHAAIALVASESPPTAPWRSPLIRISAVRPAAAILPAGRDRRRCQVPPTWRHPRGAAGRHSLPLRATDEFPGPDLRPRPASRGLRRAVDIVRLTHRPAHPPPESHPLPPAPLPQNWQRRPSPRLSARAKPTGRAPRPQRSHVLGVWGRPCRGRRSRPARLGPAMSRRRT